MANASRRVKTKIKPPRKHGAEFSVEETWAILANNIREIQKQNAANLSFEENHRFAYNMVLYKAGAKLYDGVRALIAEHLDNLAREHVIPVFPTGASQDPTYQIQESEMLLTALRHVWDDYSGGMHKLCQVLSYMDKVHTKSADVPGIWDVGLELFLKHIIRPPINEHLVTAVLKLIQLEREGHAINRSIVKGCIGVLLPLTAGREEDSVSVYKRDVEPAILSESDAFYSAEGKRLLDTYDAPGYLRDVEQRFQSEDERTLHYLSPQTTAPLRHILENRLLTPHLQTVIAMPNSGLDIMIDSNNFDDLGRLYRLYVKVPEGLACIKNAVKRCIIKRGDEINGVAFAAESLEIVDVEEKSKPTGKTKARPLSAAQTLCLALKWVQDVLDLKDKIDQVWKKSFLSNRDIEGGLNEAFEAFINRNTKSPEFISLFIDDNLKKGLKGKADHEVDAVLDRTITVFRFLVEKDIFERYYKGHLAKRLLYGRSVSDDAERGMLARLKVECGYQFTHKLESMFHDVKLSIESAEAYRNYLANTTGPGIELSVTILTSTNWPVSQPGPTCSMPFQLLKACQSFEQFYLGRHSGRRLTFQPSLGNADVRVCFKKRSHDLNVATFALIILLQFEDVAEGQFLTYEGIKDMTSIVDNELQRHLQSLACAKFKVLKKHPPGRDVDSSDSFSFNHDFTSPLQKIKISTVASKVETIDERKDTLERVDEERRYQTEACIVRIMKGRKHMTHHDLVNEVTRQLAIRFRPVPLDIKKRIEGLIERDYLERCADKKSYNYLA